MLANTMQSQHSIFKIKQFIASARMQKIQHVEPGFNRNPAPGLISHKRYNVWNCFMKYVLKKIV